MDRENRTKVGITVIVAAVVTLVVGGVLGYAFGMNTTDNASEVAPDSSRVSVAQMKLQTELSNALTQHVSLAAPALRSTFDGNADREAVAAALNENSTEVINLIGTVYEEDAKTAFAQQWRDHIGYFVDYTNAAKAGDQDAKDEALAKLSGYASDTAELLAAANSNLDAGALEQRFTQHVDQVIAVVDAYGAENYQESYEKQLAAEKHMRGVAVLLSGAIAEQFPEDY